MMFTESKVFDDFAHLRYEVILHCPYHGESLCDCHLGHVKPGMKQAAISNLSYGGDELKTYMEGLVSSTWAYTFDRIDSDRLSQDWYGGRLDDIRSVQGVRTIGHIK